MEHILPRIDPSERRFVKGIIALTMVCVLLPFLLAATVLRQGDTFLAYSTQAPGDTNVYYSMMEQAKVSGHSFFTNVFTPEKQIRAFFEPLWALLGYASGVFHLPNSATLHLARVAFGIVFLWVLYRCLYVFCPTVMQRRIAFSLVALGMGVGGYVAPFLHITTAFEFMVKNPVDVWVSEAFTFTTLMHSPLFIISQTLLLLLFTFAIRDEQRPGMVPHVVFGAIVAILAVIHPYDLPAAFVVLAALLLARIIRDKTYTPKLALYSLRRLLVMGAVAVGIGVYLISVYNLEPGFGGWARQNVTTSPPVTRYLLGYGFLLVFAVIGWVRAVRRPIISLPLLFLLAWTVAQSLLLYSPTQIQRRFTNGLQPALAILASFAVVATWEWLRRQGRLPWQRTAWRSFGLWFAPLLFFFTPIFIMTRDISTYSRQEPGMWSIEFQPASALSSMEWLRKQPAGLILSSVPNAYILSGRTLLPTYISHGHQTVGFETKLELMNSILKTKDADVEGFIRRENIRYLYWTELEREAFEVFHPERQAYLRRIYEAPAAEMYEVIPRAQ